MLLYITTGEPRDREVHPLHTIPDTVNELFYLAMREHARPAVIQFRHEDKWSRDPDWRFDRQVIRFALFLTVNLDVQAGDRVAIFGPLHPLWFQVDFAVQGLGGVPVGLPESLGDEQLVRALRESDTRAVVATDRDSANRLLRLRGRLPATATIITPFDPPSGEDGIVGIGYLWDRAQILDTPERAQNWRAGARKVDQDALAGTHYWKAGNDLAREDFTHRDAMDFVRDRVTRCPARPKDIAYFQASTVTSVTRKSAYALVGDGYTTLAIPGGAGDAAMGELAPTKIIASPAWLERLGAHVGGSAADAGRKKAQERVRDMVGEALRWIEPTAELAEQLERRLLELGLPLPALAVGAKASS